MYNEFSPRNALFVATTKALKEVLVDEAPYAVVKTLNTTTDQVTSSREKVPVLTARDEIKYTEYQTPSVVIFQPSFMPMRDMITNLEKYREIDYETGVVKVFEEPLPCKIRFKIHLATRNPDNDSVLQEWMLRNTRRISGLNVKISEDTEDYDRITMYWHDPEEMDSDDVSRIREFSVDARTYLESVSYTTAKIFRPAEDSTIAEGNYFEREGSIFVDCGLNVFPNDTEIIVDGTLEDWPISGSGVFSDEDVFTYSGRNRNTFTQVEGVDSFHHFGDRIVYVSE